MVFFVINRVIKILFIILIFSHGFKLNYEKLVEMEKFEFGCGGVKSGLIVALGLCARIKCKRADGGPGDRIGCSASKGTSRRPGKGLLFNLSSSVNKMTLPTFGPTPPVGVVPASS